MEDLDKTLLKLKKNISIENSLKSKILEHNTQIKHLLDTKSNLIDKYHKSNLDILKYILALFNINLYKQEDIYLQAIGFFYAIKNQILNKEQLQFFKVLGQQYLNKLKDKR